MKLSNLLAKNLATKSGCSLNSSFYVWHHLARNGRENSNDSLCAKPLAFIYEGVIFASIEERLKIICDFYWCQARVLTSFLVLSNYVVAGNTPSRK